MNLIKLLLTICTNALLISCTIGNGRICGPQTPAAHCDKEAYERLKYPKPYGAHWIKDDMTKESRRADIAACGAKGNESVNFLPHEIQAAKQSDDPNDIKGYLRLRDNWAQCMHAKGYVYLEYCDERCLNP